MLRAYRKPFTRGVDEGTNIGEHKEELLNSKSEWRQPSMIRNVIISGGTEVVAGGRAAPFQRAGRQGGPVREAATEVRGAVRESDNGVASRTRSRRPIWEGGGRG